MHAVSVALDPETNSPIFRNPEAEEGLIETIDPNVNTIY
jgi:hypothetical protein